MIENHIGYRTNLRVRTYIFEVYKGTWVWCLSARSMKTITICSFYNPVFVLELQDSQWYSLVQYFLVLSICKLQTPFLRTCLISFVFWAKKVVIYLYIYISIFVSIRMANFRQKVRKPLDSCMQLFSEWQSSQFCTPYNYSCYRQKIGNPLQHVHWKH